MLLCERVFLYPSLLGWFDKQWWIVGLLEGLAPERPRLQRRSSQLADAAAAPESKKKNNKLKLSTCQTPRYYKRTPHSDNDDTSVTHLYQSGKIFSLQACVLAALSCFTFIHLHIQRYHPLYRHWSKKSLAQGYIDSRCWGKNMQTFLL